MGFKVGKFEFQEKPEYVTPDGNFSFVPNRNDGPDAYDVIIKGADHFYIPDRTLEDLANPEVSTGQMMRKLENLDQLIMHMLSSYGLTSQDLHIALLQLRAYRDEKLINELHQKETNLRASRQHYRESLA